MFRELAKAAALILSILSIYALLGHAFFVPGSTWQQRLLTSAETLAMCGCVCFASGLIFSIAEQSATDGDGPRVTRTLPVQMFFWSLGGMTLLFLLQRYLEVYYVPLLWRNQPH